MKEELWIGLLMRPGSLGVGRDEWPANADDPKTTAVLHKRMFDEAAVSEFQAIVLISRLCRFVFSLRFTL